MYGGTCWCVYVCCTCRIQYDGMALHYRKGKERHPGKRHNISIDDARRQERKNAWRGTEQLLLLHEHGNTSRERSTRRRKSWKGTHNERRKETRNGIKEEATIEMKARRQRVNYALLIGKATSKNQYLAVLKAAIQHLSKIGNLCYVRRRAGKLATRSVIISFLLSTTASGV